MGKRGPQPGSVKKPEGSGRKKGQPNHATADIKAIAREYTPQAMLTLVNLLAREDAPAAQRGAARELLDRGFGKAAQIVAGDSDAPIRMINEIVVRGIRPSAAND